MLQITPLITFYSMQEELRDRAVLLGQGEYSYANLRYSSKHSAPMVLEGCIADIVHQYVYVARSWCCALQAQRAPVSELCISYSLW